MSESQKKISPQVFIAGIFLTSLLGFSSIATAKTFSSSSTQTSLVELFTSEGCSSCPPADQWLSSFKNDSGLWTQFVPVGFHVTYWDELGWKDRLASSAYTVRQKQYARQWGTQGVYTPGVVLNGREWRKWYRSQGIPHDERSYPGVLEVVQDPKGEFRAIFHPEVMKQKAEYQVNFDLLGFGISSEVSRGENSGKTLRHDFTVLDFKSKALKRRDNQWEAVASLTPSNDIHSEKYALAVWIYDLSDGSYLQATGGYLSN